MAYDHMPDGLQLMRLCDGCKVIFSDLFTFEEVAAVDAVFEKALKRIGAPVNDPQVVQIREKRAQNLIDAARKEVYPNGIIPDSETVAGLRRKTANHFKSIKQPQPAWDTYKAFLQRYMGGNA
jgi:hypothetical protein